MVMQNEDWKDEDNFWITKDREIGNIPLPTRLRTCYLEL